MTHTQVQAWLDAGERGRNRKWLAAQLSVSPKTVEGWLSSGRPIPPPVQKLLTRLMAPEDAYILEVAPGIVETIRRAAAFRRMEWRQWILDISLQAAEKILAAHPAEPAHPPDPAPAAAAARRPRKPRRSGTTTATH